MIASEATLTAPLTDAARLAWLRLIRSDNVGPVTFHDVMKRYGTAESALEALPDLSRRAARKIRICEPAQAEREYAATTRFGGRLVAIGEPDYPPWLAQIDSAPPLITVRGEAPVFARPMVAIVGSRNASVSGRKMAAMIATDLGRHGLVVASGLAGGIDATAQEAALDSGTIAVFAGGIDQIYPPENIPLAERILGEGGGQISEMPFGHSPRARDFPRRNRIVSGLALGVVIIEAAERSGSLITARLAGEQGRFVFAVPGSPLDPRAAGTNRLLKEGAILTTSAEDIIPAIEPMLSAPLAAPHPALRESEVAPMDPIAPSDAAHDRVIEALGPTPIEVDEIIRYTGLKANEVQLVLFELDLAGRIERHAGQRVSLI